MNTAPALKPDYLPSSAWAAPAVCLAGILVLHLGFAASGYPIFRDQHLGAALTYARRGVDWLHPVITGFNAGETPTPQEVPIWQAITGAIMRATSPWWGWGNVVAWALFASCVWPFFHLAREAGGQRVAWWSTLALLTQPLVIWQAGQAGTDGTALAASVWFVFAANHLVRTGSWRACAATALIGAVAATQKLPFFLSAAIAAVGLLARNRNAGRVQWVQLALAGAIATAAFLVWTSFCEQQFARAEYPLVDLRVGTNPAMREWYFGTWQQRFDPAFWARAAYRVLTGVFGSFSLAVAAGLGLAFTRQTLARWWLAGAVATTLVFTNVILQHWHYYLMICPVMALLCGDVLARAETILRERAGAAHRLIVPGGITVLLLASAQGLYTGHFLLRDPYPAQIAHVIAQHTSKDSRLLIAGGGWGGEDLMRSERNGLSIWNTTLLEQTEHLARLRSLGFTHVVLMSQSPVRASIAITGGSQTARRRWQDLVSPVVAPWPTIFESEDICILAIPDSPAARFPSAR